MLDKLASAIMNDILSGLKGFNSNISLSIEQLKDDIIDERLQIIKEYQLKGLLPENDLLMSINCIKIDCKDITGCGCILEKPTMHFEIPQLITSFTNSGINYIGSVDKTLPFIIYTDPTSLKYHKYRSRGKKLPYIYIDITPNENNMLDCWVFNAPFLKVISIIAIFKDMRQVEEINPGCCVDEPIENLTFINAEIKKRLTEKKIRYYKQYSSPNLPNNQQPQ